MAKKPEPKNTSGFENNNQSSNQNRSIFRVEAQQHYLANQQRIVFPRLLSNKFFIFLWLVALILMALGAVVTFWPFIDSILWG